jgi:hypothetical protein
MRTDTVPHQSERIGITARPSKVCAELDVRACRYHSWGIITKSIGQASIPIDTETERSHCKVR